ncbi:retinoic acid receptor responder protein 2-like [Rhinatrema bivittatum]|uniref:retinoic acid receptor responder protein 2-like n=1 Tax=Rhinatrema bivittatum TaxID=194408 RepID=UPI00112A11D2|nr:retinoic acid receptor responder protein 2-like [Rhinatrema bivittatum]
MGRIFELRDKTVALAVAEYNKKEKSFAYKELSIQNSNGTATTAGNFVKVTYTIKQTNCHKRNYQPDMCQHRANGRVHYCLACFAYQNSETEPKAQFVDCLPRFPPQQERANQQMQRCEAVKKTIQQYEIVTMKISDI